ncbi:Malonyl CoA-acyl carrier protein transacylase [Hydrogenovibrio crunogenus]|uniref:Malonyl CoA-acyl carrier protein transacylase n=1 Tax=Hydrogenovibrio crunogenus TaxID=39765 RepID=A0A4P7NY06_9GAMM|nr:ACP S-malonyltransferase [Hydrogenovibrio crunogenus]QBZ82671.1 Malonyl CoA-acyl carrier protein transacylase [Hydrogenovibrio crunogenus]
MSYAFVFPGQGSQSLGMMADMAANYPIVKTTFDEASSALGYDLWDVVQNGPEEKLNQTDITQPAMLTSGIATWRALAEQKELSPAFLAGHSLGEYSALVAAGVMTLAQGVRLVAERGRLMQSAVPAGEGAMAAVLGLEDQQIMDICAEQDGVVEAVNFNSPGQVVIAGEKKAVDAALPAFEAAGAKRVVLLSVSVPSHCSLMKPAAEALAKELEGMTLNAPNIPVLHNASVESYQDEASIKRALIEQLYRPVQWVKTIEQMKESGVDSLYELGPGKVLMGLNRRIDRKMGMQAVYDSATLTASIETL